MSYYSNTFSRTTINRKIADPNFNISTAVFSQSKSVSAQDAIPDDIAWNNDGSKMYVVGNLNNSIYEYNLSTFFDISTAVFSQSKDLSDQDINLHGMAWNNDGSKMYVAGSQNENVYEYNLSTFFDISTAVFSQSKDVLAQDTVPDGIAWNNDGSKMYVVGNLNNSIYEYNLSTFFDISTAVFSQSKSVSAQDTVPNDIAWNNDGSKMYVAGSQNDSVYEYNLSTFFDISTAVFSQSKDVSAQDTVPNGMAWNNDGSKMYVVGSQNDSIYEYNLA